MDERNSQGQTRGLWLTGFFRTQESGGNLTADEIMPRWGGESGKEKQRTTGELETVSFLKRTTTAFILQEDLSFSAY